MSKASVKSLYLHFLDEYLSTDERFSQMLEENALALLDELDASKARITRAESDVRKLATNLGVARLNYSLADPIGAMVDSWNNQADNLNAIWGEGVCDMERLGPSLLPSDWSVKLERQEAQARDLVKTIVESSAEFPSRWNDALRKCSSGLQQWGVEDLAELYRQAQEELGVLVQDWQQLLGREDLTLTEVHKFWSTPKHKKFAETVRKAEQECEELCKNAILQREREEQERKERERLEREKIKREREEQERKERERAKREREEQERKERERVKREREEQERLRLESEAKERKEKEKLDRERGLEERHEREQRELERLERERLQKKQKDIDRKEKEKLERNSKLNERLEQEREELERLELERVDAARKAAERKIRKERELERLELERVDAARKAAERKIRKEREQERLAAQQAIEARKRRNNFIIGIVGVTLGILANHLGLFDGGSTSLPPQLGFFNGGSTSLPPQPAWLKAGLYGHDNAAAALKPVRITEAKTGTYSVTINNQFEFTCSIEFDGNGDPARLKACSAATGWAASPKVIDMRCDQLPTEIVCRGKYQLSSGSNYSSASEMVIARRR